MKLTDYHTKYFAYELTRRCPPDSVDKLGSALVDAQIALNPHQVDAALFAFRSPLSRGAILADEVGLGKTIEAGLVLAQKWAENKRRILVVVPSNLRTQWRQELKEKFFLPCRILDTKSYQKIQSTGQSQPFDTNAEVVICSYDFVRRRSTEVQAVQWDLVILDEAHRLRNVYKANSVVAASLRTTLARYQKLLLTATPLQNSLLELYGLVSFIDEHAFGDLKSFREQFATLRQGRMEQLKLRLAPFCHRTLREQVLAYVPYTKRQLMTEDFNLSIPEAQLYKFVTEYLQRPSLLALRSGQRTLTTMVLRKLMASSTFAIAAALSAMANRLATQLALNTLPVAIDDSIPEALVADYETLDETADEWNAELDETNESAPAQLYFSPEKVAEFETEIAELNQYADLAASIVVNTKSQALLKVLGPAFERVAEIGAPRKALIFTESRRTQDYLQRVLESSSFSKGVVLFNGSNNDPSSQRIYQSWKELNKGTDRITGVPTADIRSALVDYFRSDEGQIMIATEAGAEGINLQFCSLVINYDLPWNPQRVEQRIGRCHRYGQKHDVVVVNFLNQDNPADKRVYQLLKQKFNLFEGVFGASDEILGALQSGVDVEKRIADIYQNCRHPNEITAAFDQLQADLGSEIGDSIRQTQAQLLEHFDETVTDRLKKLENETKQTLDSYERQLLHLTQHELSTTAHFSSNSLRSFNLLVAPPELPHLRLGHYELPRSTEGDDRIHDYYRLRHPLANLFVKRAKFRKLALAAVEFDYTAYRAEQGAKMSPVEEWIGRSGWMQLSQFSTESRTQGGEDYLLWAAVADDGQELPAEVITRFFRLPALTQGSIAPSLDTLELLDTITDRVQAIQHQSISERNALAFAIETDKLDSWSDDQKSALETDLKELDRQIKEARRAATAASGLNDKLNAQKQVRDLEGKRNQQRRALFDAQDKVDEKREALIADVEAQLKFTIHREQLFTIYWTLK
jgi:adenine-specific DNA-methyltransferase